jgi:lipoprotein-releasing system permease protein
VNFELFIARKIIGKRQKSFSTFIVNMAIAAVALSLTVMIIAVSSVEGFRMQITDKLFGLWGHVQVTTFVGGPSTEDARMPADQAFLTDIADHPEIRHVQVFAQKPGVIRTEEHIEGVVLKGVGADFDWDWFSRFLIAGQGFEAGDSTAAKGIVISSITAERLNLKVDSELVLYFIQQPPRVRKLKISGIYKTGLMEYDKRFALMDIRHIQRLNGWDANEIGGYEIYLHDYEEMDSVGQEIHTGLTDPTLIARTMKERDEALFDWLRLMKTNGWVILGLMVLVGGINMITALLVLILERTNMIGVLKALGAPDGAVQRIFIYHAMYIVSIGLLIGNVLGLGLGWLQQTFSFIPLSEESYYVSTVPIDLQFWPIVALNVGTLLVCTLAILADRGIECRYIAGVHTHAIVTLIAGN